MLEEIGDFIEQHLYGVHNYVPLALRIRFTWS